MTEQSQTPETPEEVAAETSGAATTPQADVPAPVEPMPVEAGPGPPPGTAAPPPPLPPLPPPEQTAAGVASERPELAVGAAFAGGFVFAMILKRLAR